MSVLQHPLKFSGTHYKRIFWNMRLFADSSDWKKQTEVTDSYLYVGSKEYLHPWKQVNPKVGKIDFRNSKGANRHLRKSNDKICCLNQKVKMTSWTIYHFRCRFSRVPILAKCLCHTISVQTDSVNMECVVRCGQRNHFWQWLYVLCNTFQIGNGCDTVTQLLLLILTHM